MGAQDKARVLIVEDEALSGQMTQRLLEALGYLVVGRAMNGRQAVEMTQSLQPDVVLMDIGLPDIDGVEVIRRINVSCPTPVVMLTAYDTPELIERATGSGAGAYLIKPVDGQEIERAMAVAIARFDDTVELRRLNTQLQAEITERKRAEEALRESEERYRALVESSSEHIFMLSRDGIYLTSNSRVGQCGLESGGSLVGRHLQDVYPSEVAEFYQQQLEQVLATGQAVDFEHPMPKPDGDHHYLDILYPIYRDGQIWAVGGICRDITERTRIEALLRSSLEGMERQQRTLLALSQAAQGVQRAHTPEEVYQAIGDEVTRLGYNAVALTLTDDRKHLALRHLTFEPALVQRVGKLTGLSAQDIRFPLALGDLFQQVITEKETIFRESSLELMAEAVPQPLHPLVGRLAVMLGIEQGIVSPLVIGSETHGILAVTGAGLTEADVPAVATFANQAAIALENAKLYQQTHDRAVELFSLNRASQALTSSLDIQRVLSQIVNLAGSVVDAAHTSIVLVNEDDSLGISAEDFRGGPPIEIRARPQGITHQIIASRECMVFDEVLDDGTHNPTIVAAGVRSYAGLPLIAKEKVLGVLFVHSYAPSAFRDRLPLLKAFANRAAIAIENARLFKAEYEQRELAEALEEAATAVSSTLNLDEVLGHILEQTERVVAGDAFTVILIEDDVARLTQWRGYEPLDKEKPPSRFDIPMATYPYLMKMVQTGKPVIVSDTSLDPDWVPSASDKAWRRSYVAVPMQLGDTVVGFLGVSGTRPGQFGPEDARRMEALANHAATAIKNARLYEDTQQKTTELELLLDTATAVSSTLEPDRILRSVAEKMTTSVGVSFCRIALLNENNQTLTIRAAFAVHDLDWDPGLGRQVALADAPWHRQAVETNEIIVLRQDDPSQAASEAECRMALSESVQSALLIPLVVGNRVLGVVSLGEMRSWERIPVTADRVKICQAMANQSAIAVRNAQLLDAVIKHRRDLQELSTQLINAQEVERRRLARELHDELGQALTMMSINLEAIEEELTSDLSPTIRGRLTETSSLVSQLLEQVRELALDLRPYMLDDFGLTSALRWYVNRYAKRLNIEVQFEVIDLDDRLPAAMETVLYRVVQEALTNVARHAQANRVRLRLARKEFTASVLIEDDGRGFDVQEVMGDEALARGVGLLGIRERVASLGGSFSIQSGPREGTRLTIEIPV